MAYFQSKSKAISLVELMVTIAVMGVLAGGTVYIVKNQTTNAYIADGLTQMDALESATRTFYSMYNCLPGDCAVSSVTNLPSGVTVNSGNQDGVVNNWWSVGAVQSAGFAGLEDVNAIQQLVATGFLAAVPNGDVSDVVPSASILATSLDILLPGYTQSGAIVGYGTPNIIYAYGTNNMQVNNIYNVYSKYYLHGKAPNIYFGIRSVFGNNTNATIPNSNMITMTGNPNAIGKSITGTAGNVVSFIISVVASFANQSSTTMDTTSYNVMAGMDKKVDGDTPLSGSNQGVLISFTSGLGTASQISLITIPLALGSTSSGAFQAYTNATSGTSSPLTGINFSTTYISASAGNYSNFGTGSGSWSNFIPSSLFNYVPISNTGVYSTTNRTISLDLVRPIYGLN